MLKCTSIVLALFLTTAGVARAQSPAAPQADDAALTALAPEAIVEAATVAGAMPAQAVQSHEDWLAEFEDRFGQALNIAQNGRVFYSGFATVSADSAADPHYGSQLALAYERAMFDMQADFILQNYGRLKAKTVRTLFEDQSSNHEAFDPLELQKAVEAGGGRLEALLDKAVTLLDKKLDNALIQEGVPAEDVQKMTVEQKKNLFKDNLNKQILKSAYRNMQGLVPVQTRMFPIEENGKKTMAVAVIAVQSEKTRQFARDIARKRPTLVTGTPKALKEILPGDVKGYLDEVGLRYVYDEAGRPMLLSYGRMSVPMAPDWSASRAVRAKQNAQGIAQAMAEAGVIEFMNTNLKVSASIDVGDVAEDWVHQITEVSNGKPGEVQLVREQIRETTQTFFKSGTATASGDLRGTSILKRWEAKDDNGVLHVGTVVGWTYGQLENAKAIDSPGRVAGAASRGAGGNTASDQARVSKTVNNKDDF